MATISIKVKLKKPTRKKHRQWVLDQVEYSNCINWCITEILAHGKKLSSKDVPFKLKSCIRNEAIRKAKKALSDYYKDNSRAIPVFKATTPISVNNQNWDTMKKGGKWYIGFTSSLGKLYLPVVESRQVIDYFGRFERVVRDDANRQFRGTIQLIRKGRDWYVCIPIEISSELPQREEAQYTTIGIDLGLRHIAVASEPVSGRRVFFSGKKVGYVRRHFYSLRKNLGKKKALRAMKNVGKKERRVITDYNRKLASGIIRFSSTFDNPLIKMEDLKDIREHVKATPRNDRNIHSWAFHQLQECIRNKAIQKGIPVMIIDPRYTSQKCFICGNIDRRNRAGSKFRCRSCGHASHADLNASRNIAKSTSTAA